MIRDTSAQDVVIKPQRFRRIGVKFGLGLALCVLLSAIAYPSISRMSQADLSVDTNRVRMAKVTRGVFIRDIALQGNIVAAHSPKLYAPAVGTVTMLFNPGASVKTGEVLASVDSPELTNQLKQEQAKLASLGIELERTQIAAKQARMKSRQEVQLEEVLLEAAKRELRRAEHSIQIKAISQLDYEKAIDELKRSQLKYDFAVEQAQLQKENQAFELKTLQFSYNQFKLQVENTERQVNELQIVAPVNGVVGAWLVDQKAAVARNQPLLTVVDLSSFEVEIEIPESYVDQLGIGMNAKVHYNGNDYEAQVMRVSPEVIDKIVKGRLAFSHEPPPGIKQNQRVDSRVILDQRDNVLTLPRGSLLQHFAGQKAFVVDHGLATLSEIRIGDRSLDKVEVLSGLEEGQEVIISNTEFVKDAQTLLLN